MAQWRIVMSLEVSVAVEIPETFSCQGGMLKFAFLKSVFANSSTPRGANHYSSWGRAYPMAGGRLTPLASL